MTSQRASDGGKIKDILEIGLTPKGKIMIGDIGLRPFEPYQTSRWAIYRTLRNFYERVISSKRGFDCLVPMSTWEYQDYCQWKDAQTKPEEPAP